MKKMKNKISVEEALVQISSSKAKLINCVIAPFYIDFNSVEDNKYLLQKHEPGYYTNILNIVRDFIGGNDTFKVKGIEITPIKNIIESIDENSISECERSFIKENMDRLKSIVYDKKIEECCRALDNGKNNLPYINNLNHFKEWLDQVFDNVGWILH
ncbi:MAG: hypothetical protein QW783_00910 [Candidatus Micrarchaeia archaeon]